MSEYYNNSRTIMNCRPIQYSKGSICAINTGSNVWCRAVILSDLKQETSMVEVHLVDYGCNVHVKINQIKQLLSQFTKIPRFTIPCYLSEVFTIQGGNNWTDETCTSFQQLMEKSEDFYAHVISNGQSNCYEVILETPTGEVINETLVTLGLASSTIFPSNSNNNNDMENNKQKSSNNDQNLLRLDDPMMEDFLDVDNTRHYRPDCIDSLIYGIRNKDETRLCKFYKSGKTCRRGDTCPWIHECVRPDGLPSGGELVHSFQNYYQDLPKEGSFIPLIVTSVESLSQFYVHLISDNEDPLDIMKLEMKSHYKNAIFESSETNIGLGEVLVAYSPSIGFQRAVVIGELDSHSYIKVQFVDTGLESHVRLDQVQPIAPQFLQIPPQAIECWLTDLEHNNKVSNHEVIQQFIKITKDEVIIGHVTEIDRYNTRIGLQLYRASTRENVTTLLLDSGFVNGLKL